MRCGRSVTSAPFVEIAGNRTLSSDTASVARARGETGELFSISDSLDPPGAESLRDSGTARGRPPGVSSVA